MPVHRHVANTARGYGDFPTFRPSRRPARPANGTAPTTEDGEAPGSEAVPLPNLRVLRRAEQHARVAHHQETPPGEWRARGPEGVDCALTHVQAIQKPFSSYSQPLRHCAVAARYVPQRACEPNTSAGRSRRGRARPRSPGALSRLPTSPFSRSRSRWSSRWRCWSRLPVQLPRPEGDVVRGACHRELKQLVIAHTFWKT